MNRELEKLRCSNQPVDGSKLKHVDPVHETVDDLMKPLFLFSCSPTDLFAQPRVSDFCGMKGVERWMDFAKAHPLFFEAQWFEDGTIDVESTIIRS